MNKIIEVGYGNVNKVKIGGSKKLVFIGGPCAIETREHTFKIAKSIKKICDELKISWIFKACYDKDCRSSINSYHGVGISEGLKILSDVRDAFNIPVVSDFSDSSWASETAEVVAARLTCLARSMETSSRRR